MATRNINQNWNNQIGGNLFGFGGDNQGIATPNLVPENKQQYFSGTNPGAYGSGDWRSKMNQLYNWGDSGARYNYDRPYNMRDVAGEVGEYSQRPGEGITATNAAQDKTNFLQKIMDNTLMGKLMGSFKRPEDMQTAYESITDSIDPNTGRGTYKGNEYRIEGNKIYSALFPEGKNFDSMFGSKSIEEMENEGYGSIGWAQERLQKGKNISQRLRNILKSRGIDEGGNWMDRPTNEGAQFKATVPTGPIDKGAGSGKDTSQPSWGGTGSVEAYDKSQQATYDRAKDRHTGGNWGAAPGTAGGWNPGARDGGRIGYALAGPVGVEQQTDFIEGPEGGEEFQETVVEGQEQPSREQLEALAMEIFQLPLEELDEQQLVVVYQEAMQGQPMEEAVQEEDVQFAANGGLAGLL